MPRPLQVEKPPSTNAPGGQEGVRRLASITGRPELPLNPENGLEAPCALAVIDEAWCIGCTLCIKACPTDAILGANKRMHTVIADHCTGCELCIPVCPVDCIELINASADTTGWSAWSAAQAEHARSRYGSHLQRTGRKANAPVRTTAQPAAQEPALAVTTAAPAQDKRRRLPPFSPRPRLSAPRIDTK